MSGCGFGLASRGTIGPDPALQLIVADRELVVLVDDDAGIVLWESHTDHGIVTAATTVRPGEDLGAILALADFPVHGLAVRPNRGRSRPVYKDIASLAGLEAAVAECGAAATDGSARVESDLPAHACPSRRPVIAAAVQRLAERLASRCPACQAPGWGQVQSLVGVPCTCCGPEVMRAHAQVDGCVACPHREVRPLPAAAAGPAECPWCNP